MSKYRIVEKEDGTFEMQERMFLLFWITLGKPTTSMFMTMTPLHTLKEAEERLQGWIELEKRNKIKAIYEVREKGEKVK